MATAFNDIEQRRDAELQFAKGLIVSRYLGRQTGANVVGVGIGEKYVGGKKMGYQCIRVYVNQKASASGVPSSRLIPARIGDFETDVIEVGVPFTPRGRGRRCPVSASSGMPAPGKPGSSIGLPPEATKHLGTLVSGTLGAILDGENKKSFLVSCNHVLSLNGHVKEGTDIETPAPQDRQGTEKIVIAKTRKVIMLRHDRPNEVDCAVAELVNPPDDDMRLFGFGDDRFRVTKSRTPEVGQKVFKVGKTSGLTTGTIVDVSADILVDYSFGGFQFTNQVLIEGDRGEEFASDGDSGAIVLTAGRPYAAVAMVFAPAGKYTAASSIVKVTEMLTAPQRDEGRPPGPKTFPFDLKPGKGKWGGLEEG